MLESRRRFTYNRAESLEPRLARLPASSAADISDRAAGNQQGELPSVNNFGDKVSFIWSVADLFAAPTSRRSTAG